MKKSWSLARVRMVAGPLALFLTIGVLALVPGTARADSAPPSPSPATPTTVTADGLPTVQINGVAWSQVVVGNTVYVAGSFTTARPAGAAPGTQQVPRNNVLAYDIRTGDLITSFAPSLNGQALIIAASPDGSRIYVGGDFTQVNGQTRNRVAALTPAGALVAGWAPSVNSQVRAIAATNDTVYLGGSISAVGGVSRTRLAAVSATDGSLLPWAPQPGFGDPSGNRNGNFATSNEVLALVVTGGGTQVVAAGRFDSLNGVKATGVGALDAGTGATRPFAVNQLLTNQGVNSAIWSLSTDGTHVFGTGYDFYGPGNLEGSFNVLADGGVVQAINACHGDTYSTFPLDGVLYQATHAHQCQPIGGYPEQPVRVNKFATAVTIAATHKVQDPMLRGISFVGQPAPTLLDWFPTMSAGSFTGQFQAGWSVAGNSDYVVYGGEFPKVNGVDQQGLVRYTRANNGAPNRIAPVAADGLTPTVVSVSAGTARVSWQATYDDDNEYLTYRVVRNGNTAAPVYETPAPGAPSTWWNTPTMGFIDRGLTPGATYTYRVYALDPFGNQATRGTTSVTVSAATGGGGQYADTVIADGASDYWRLDEPTGTTQGYDQAGFSDLAVGTGVTRGAAGAIAGSSNTASSFDGTSNGLAATQTALPGPDVFSAEAWFKTSSTAGGKILGFGSANTGISSNRDRHIYMDPQGHVYFGVYTGVRQPINGNGVYNDNAWHQVVATLGANGMVLYVDGVQTASLSTVTGGQAYNGFWRIGGDRGWSGADYWTGTVDDVAIYPTVLSAGQVANHFSIGSSGSAINVAPTAAFTATPTNLSADFDASGSADSDGTVASYAWDFGDSSAVVTATDPAASHVYAAAGTYTVTLTVTDDDGATNTVSHPVTVTEPPANTPPTAAFTATPTNLSADFDASASQDAEGPIAAYAWDYGDGQHGTGVTSSHPYASGGTYPVTLTVTDGAGATGTVSHDVTVTAPAGPAVLVDDSFDRTVSGGLGTAPVGGPWTVSAGGSRQSVASGIATLSLPAAGNNTGSYLAGISETDVDVLTSFSVSSMPTGAGTYIYLTGRRAGADEYRVRARLLPNGTVALTLSRLSGGTEAFPGGETILPGLTFAAGTPLSMRMQVSGTGPTAISATVWRSGTTQPATPQRTWSDATAALQTAGAVGVTVHRPSGTTAMTTVQLSDFRVTGAGGGTPANAPPSPSFTATPTGLTVAVDASASTDDGTITNYAWAWGDAAAAGSGVTASHPYTAAGTYTITLTATDDAGATATTTRTVTVTAPPANQPPAAEFTATPNGLSASFDASASTDDGSIVGWAWNFGDGQTSTAGPTTTHDYAAAGSYDVTLTVTDNGGTTDDVTHSVTVTDTPGPAVLVNDTFNRTATNGLGTADTGGAWTVSAGGTRQSVTPGPGAELTLPSAGLNTGSSIGSGFGNADIRTTFSLDVMPTGAGTYVYVTGRRVSAGNEYRVRVRVAPDGRVYLALSRLIGNAETFPGGEIVVPGLTYTLGSSLDVRVLVTGFGSGTSSLAATVWRTGTGMPASAQLTRTDTTAGLQSAGGLGLLVHRPSGTTAATTVRFSSFLATETP